MLSSIKSHLVFPSLLPVNFFRVSMNVLSHSTLHLHTYISHQNEMRTKPFLLLYV